jgi:hypothetical protein
MACKVDSFGCDDRFFWGTAKPRARKREELAPLSDQQIGELQATVDRHRDVFAGLWGDPVTHVVTVSLASQSAGQRRTNEALNELAKVGGTADQQIRTRPKLWSVEVSTSGPSLAILDTILSRVTTSEPWASDARGALVLWGIDPRLHAVVIGLTAITPKLRADAERTFSGLARLSIEQPLKLQDRSIDSQPYYSSDRIAYSLATSPCTSGFEAYDPNASSHRGVLTAGHCYPLNAVAVQGFYDNNNVLHKSGNIGKVTRRSYGPNMVDTEFLDAAAVGTSLSDFVWRGPNPPTGVTKPSGIGTAAIGSTLCFDGAITGENCHGVVNNLNFCATVDGNVDCSLYQAVSNNGSILGRYGDSGGPVFKDDGLGGLTAYGTMTASPDSGVTEWYTDITAQLNALNVGLIFN